MKKSEQILNEVIADVCGDREPIWSDADEIEKRAVERLEFEGYRITHRGSVRIVSRVQFNDWWIEPASGPWSRDGGNR